MPRTDYAKMREQDRRTSCVRDQTFVMGDDLAEPNTLLVAMQSAMAQHIRSLMYKLQLGMMAAVLFLVTLEWKVIARFAF